jgi:hypothetical protein
MPWGSGSASTAIRPGIARPQRDSARETQAYCDRPCLRVGDVDSASAELEAAGCELLGEVTRVPEMNYAYRHFKGLDGRVYGINEQK